MRTTPQQRTTILPKSNQRGNPTMARVSRGLTGPADKIHRCLAFADPAHNRSPVAPQ